MREASGEHYLETHRARLEDAMGVAITQIIKEQAADPLARVIEILQQQQNAERPVIRLRNLFLRAHSSKDLSAQLLADAKSQPDQEGVHLAKAAERDIESFGAIDPRHPDDWQEAKKYLAAWSSQHYGEPPPGASRFMALRWMLAAFERLEKEKEKAALKNVLFWMVSNSRMWPDCQSFDEIGFKALKSLAASKLTLLQAEYEENVYHRLGFGELLGHLGADCASRPLRQDRDAGLKVEGLETSEEYMYLLFMASLVLDKSFQPLLASGLELLLGSEGKVFPAPPKSFMRMYAKLFSDHKDVDEPKPAANADSVRTAVVVPAAQLADIFEQVARLLGQPLRVKNNYASSFDASQTKGYRAILASYMYDSGKSWPELADAFATAHAACYDEVSQICKRLDSPPEQFLEWVDNAARAFKDSAKGPAKMIVEVQFMTTEYYVMRKQTHAWYKIDRAERAWTMCSDFLGGLKDD